MKLFDSRKDGLPHIPTFAQGMLTVLKERGLLHRTDTEPPRNVRRVKLDKGQELWIRFDTHRDRREGYMDVEVLDAPRSDGAILAAMVAWTGRPVDFEQLVEAHNFLASEEWAAQSKKINNFLDRMDDRAEDLGFEEWKAIHDYYDTCHTKCETIWPIDFILPLLRYYKPEVFSYSPQEFDDM